MGNSFGQNRVLFTERFGRSIQVSADGAPKYKAGGITFDWASVPALAQGQAFYMGVATKTDAAGATYAEFEDGVIVKVNEKAIRYGTVVVYDPALDTASVVDGDPNGAYRPATGADAALMTRSNTFIVNETWTEDDSSSNHFGVMDGGRMWRARVLVAESVDTAGDLYTVGGAALPTLAAVEAAMPLVVWALDN